MTGSAKLPHQNPYQPSLGGGFASYYTDAFVTKLNSAGSGLVYSTYLGGSGSEEGNGIAVDCRGECLRNWRHKVFELPHSESFSGFPCPL